MSENAVVKGVAGGVGSAGIRSLQELAAEPVAGPVTHREGAAAERRDFLLDAPIHTTGTLMPVGGDSPAA